MPVTPAVRPTTKRRIGAVAAAAVGVLLLSACLTADESTAVTLINQDRAANGSVRALVVNDAAVTKAQGWARHLADASRGVCSAATLSHSNLTDGAPSGWKRLGENVACRTVTGSVANAVAPLEAQFMASTGHRANILDARYTHVGVGIASVSIGTNRWVVFETQFFVQL